MMKKKTLLASAVLAAISSAAFAQSSVQIYGIVDGAARYTTNAEPKGAPNASLKQLVSGMSQSRLGINVAEDLGGGLRTLANLEHRFNLKDGTVVSPTDFWRQAWVGLQSKDFGRVTLGRQYNVLFDVVTTTYASFKYSPYIEAFKPEIGFSLGARNNNMIKWAGEFGPMRAEVQASAGEGSPTGGKSVGGMLRYGAGAWAFGGGYETLYDGPGNKAKGMTVGGSYSDGPIYVTLAWARNKFDPAFNPAIIGALLIDTNGTFALGNVDHRDMVAVGLTYQITTSFNLGGHYWRAKQTGKTVMGDGKGDFFAVVGDYALSKRTDAYVEFDHTKFGGNIKFTNGETSRNGAMVGLRHRF